MRNIGPKSIQWLNAVGVYNTDDLRKIGSSNVFLKVKQKGFPVSLNLLWALEGAIKGKPWFSLSASEKMSLKDELKSCEEKLVHKS